MNESEFLPCYHTNANKNAYSSSTWSYPLLGVCTFAWLTENVGHFTNVVIGLYDTQLLDFEVCSFLDNIYLNIDHWLVGYNYIMQDPLNYKKKIINKILGCILPVMTYSWTTFRFLPFLTFWFSHQYSHQHSKLHCVPAIYVLIEV